jgi:hypothetical protein
MNATASEMLNQLGGTASAIASTLNEKGIKGVRHTARFLNPIVRYLRTQLPADVTLELRPRGIIRVMVWDGAQEEVMVPDAIQKFLAAFDAGEFPELELSETEVWS